jgi:hypothetical protein
MQVTCRKVLDQSKSNSVVCCSMPQAASIFWLTMPVRIPATICNASTRPVGAQPGITVAGQ